MAAILWIDWLKGHLRTRFPCTFNILRRFYRLLIDYWKPPQGDLVSALERFCEVRTKQTRLSFIQVGANTGNDEFASLRRRYHWKGVMLEPQKEVFEELVRLNREEGVVFEQAAISDHECEKTLYKVAFSNARWATGLASFEKQMIERHIKDGFIVGRAAREGVTLPEYPEEYYATEIVRCTTLRCLVEKHRLESFDILLVDTEGHDYEIVKQIGQLRHSPRVILFEHKHLSTRDFKHCVRFLRSRRFRLLADDTNTIAIAEGETRDVMTG